eukprot:1011169-Prymnesium_polylepis.1
MESSSARGVSGEVMAASVIVQWAGGAPWRSLRRWRTVRHKSGLAKLINAVHKTNGGVLPTFSADVM